MKVRVFSFISAAAVILGLSLVFSNAQELPFEGGRYTTNSKLCSLSKSEIFAQSPKGAILLYNDFLYNYYTGSECQVSNAKIIDENIIYDSTCYSEGVQDKSREIIVRRSDTSFETDGIVYSLCQPSYHSTLNPEQILEFQENLIAMGFNPGAPDGKYGSNTRRAMNQFQAQQGLRLTEEIDKQTDIALLKEVQALLKQVEPASGEQLEQNQITTNNDTKSEQKTADYNFALHRDNLEELREYLIAYPDVFYESMRHRQVSERSNVLKDKSAIKRLLAPAAGFVACWDSPATIYGYYNVVQNIWSIFWMNSDGVIEDARLTTGFSPKHHPRSNAWFNLAANDLSYAEAIKKSLFIQMGAFGSLFHEEACTTVREKFDYTFVDNEATAIILLNEIALKKIPNKVSTNIETSFKKYHADFNTDYILTSPDGTTFDFLSFHTSLKDPMVMIIQQWNVGDDKLEIGSGWLVDLLENLSGN